MKKKKASLKLRWIHPSPLCLRLLSPLHKMQEKLCINRVMENGTKDLLILWFVMAGAFLSVEHVCFATHALIFKRLANYAPYPSLSFLAYML